MKGITDEEQVLTYWHDPMILIISAGGRVTVTYMPRAGYVYLVFGLTMGKPRDYATGDVLTTDDYGFWHRHSQMRWHWNPGIEAIYEFAEPQFLKVTEDDPLELEFANNTGLTVIHDLNIHLFECAEEHWPIVQQYLKGLFKALYEKGAEAK
jgi:hypothetical protein